jgi:hypothetical protein
MDFMQGWNPCLPLCSLCLCGEIVKGRNEMVRLAQVIDGLGFIVPGSFQQSDTIYTNVMVASTAQYVTVPAGANIVVIGVSGGADLYLLEGVSNGLLVPGATATEAAGALSIPELLPGAAGGPFVRQVKAGASIGIISPGTPVVTLSFYS